MLEVLNSRAISALIIAGAIFGGSFWVGLAITFVALVAEQSVADALYQIAATATQQGG